MHVAVGCAATFTAMEAILPIFGSYQKQVNVFTPGNAQIISNASYQACSWNMLEAHINLSTTLYI